MKIVTYLVLSIYIVSSYEEEFDIRLLIVLHSTGHSNDLRSEG